MADNAGYQLDVDRFSRRIERVHSHLIKHRNLYNTKVIVITPPPTGTDTNPYLKSKVLHTFLFGYELPDTLLIMTESKLVFIGSRKKADFLSAAESSLYEKLSFELLTWDKKAGLEPLVPDIEAVLPKESESFGVLAKEYDGHTSKLASSFRSAFADRNGSPMDVTGTLSLCLSVKNEDEINILQKSAVLTNKVLKRYFVPRLESIIDQEVSVTHEALAQDVENVIEEPTKIQLNVPQEDVESCYFPIIQSGGSYELKVSAQSNDSLLKHDVIIASFGSRYKMYCSNVARTFLIDPPKDVTETYNILLQMQEACLKEMIPGKPLKSVRAAAVKFLKSEKKPDLIECLPKTLGFAIGIDFRDAALTLNSKSNISFRSGMCFYLGLGFSNVAQKGNSGKKYALLIGDTVNINEQGKAAILTKHAKSSTDITYTISKNDSSSSDDEDVSVENKAKRGSQTNGSSADAQIAKNMDRTSKRSSSRTAEVSQANVNAIADREKKQILILKRRNETRLREIARSKTSDDTQETEADELQTYKKTSAYPEGAMGHVVKVDMANEAILLPINGIPVPFHISCIKSVVLPDPDSRATYLRINFYGAGQTIPKDASANMSKLIGKHAHWATFIREVTYRSIDGSNLTQAFRQISELRKRFRNRIQQKLLESTLVTQDRLQRIKNERVSRLSDVTMRPVLSGRKTQGNLEVHSNGLRFVSSKGEMLDLLYNNVQSAIFQPCENEIMVLLHFHLKNDIMIGKKKFRDVQFYTEVVEASMQLENRSAAFDPDEVDDEQRERQLRKKLNVAFKEFARKVESTAKRFDHELEFDIPYRDLGFNGTPHREMVFMQPTLNSLINVTETPFFCIPLDEIDHVHFERVTFASKAFDMVLVNKDFSKQPWRVDMIGNDDKDGIQDWLTDMEISFTEGPMNLNWKSIMNTVKDDDRFYEDTEEDLVTTKEAGWEFLRMSGRDSDESDEDGEESDFSQQSEESESESNASEDYASETSEGSFVDDELSEEGMDWEDMEREAAADDQRKNRFNRNERDRDSSSRKRRRR